MVDQISAIVEAGDLLPRGEILIGPAGLGWAAGTISWGEIARVGGNESASEWNAFKGLSSAGVLGIAAAAVTGPVGIGAAVLVGAALGTSRHETFEIWSNDGRYVTLKCRVGTMKRARELRDIAVCVLKSVGNVPAEKSNKRKLTISFWK